MMLSRNLSQLENVEMIWSVKSRVNITVGLTKTTKTIIVFSYFTDTTLKPNYTTVMLQARYIKLLEMEESPNFLGIYMRIYMEKFYRIRLIAFLEKADTYTS